MEAGGGSCSMSSEAALALVKEESEYVVHVCIKIEAESDEVSEAEHLKPDPACAVPEPVVPERVKREEGLEDLYADHEVKGELVLGPELLQRLRAAECPTTAHHEVKTTGTKQETEAPWITNPALQPAGAGAIDTFMCDACGKLFQEKYSLVHHIKSHLRKNPKMLPKNAIKKVFYCKICNKKFYQSGHFNRHKQTHTCTRQHVCNICKKQFSRADSLRLHKHVHTGQKPYSCEFCEKGFTQIGNLTRHIRIHTGEKPYVCDICSKRCTQSGDLKTHKMIHGIDSPYTCGVCNKGFKQKSTLSQHARVHARRKLS